MSLVSTTSEVGTDNNLTVRQNLAFWAPVYGLWGRAARARINELLERLDLTGKADAWPMHISAGQRQRLALARALLGHNPLVFLDEPTNKLDSDGVRSVRSLIDQHEKRRRQRCRRMEPGLAIHSRSPATSIDALHYRIIMNE